MATKLNSSNEVAEVVIANNMSTIAGSSEYLVRANYSETIILAGTNLTDTSFYYGDAFSIAGYREKTFIYTSLASQTTYAQLQGCRNTSFLTTETFSIGSATSINSSSTEYTTLSDEIPYIRLRYNNSTAANGSGSFSAWMELATY